MASITSVSAYCNNEVAFVAWDIDEKIPDCLGFEVTRVYLDEAGNVAIRDGKEDRVRCAAWVAFKGQRNLYWLPQDTGIWPVQKLSWRDLTLRKRRNEMKLRPDEVRVRYEVRAVGDLKPGMEAAPDPTPKVRKVTKRDKKGKLVLDANGKPVRIEDKAYTGTPRPLGYLGPAVASNDLHITRRLGQFQSTFTNGILAAQWLSNVLLADGKVQPDELINKLSNPGDPHRKYLAGDVLPMLRELLGREGEFFLALYELDDQELVELLLKVAGRIHLILANTGAEDDKWDARNKAARQKLIDAGVDIQHRMFNSSGHIGHNKFVVHVPPSGTRSVFTGSTNWTSTGLAGQTNNALLIEDDGLAEVFLGYWDRMKADVLAVPTPFSKPMPDNVQGKTFRKENETPLEVTVGSAKVQCWFSPNTQRVSKGTQTPLDLTEVYRRMRLAKDAILFLAFYPGQSGKDCIIGKAVEFGRDDKSLIVTGAVSSANAMPNYVAKDKKGTEDESDDVAAISPHTFSEANVSIVRAARIDDRSLLGDFGLEQLTARGSIGAIVHDKVVVIDPLSDDCTVILGSHNLGFKASYANDENLLIVTGHKALAQAYAVHILDVYDHYRFRAVEAERKKQGKKGWSGFLEKDDSWQDDYVAQTKGALVRYLARSN